MVEVQCTIWMKKDSNLRFGKAVFSQKDKQSPSYSVPCPARIVPALYWCEKHARNIGGYVRELGGNIAVFRIMGKTWMRKK